MSCLASILVVKLLLKFNNLVKEIITVRKLFIKSDHL